MLSPIFNLVLVFLKQIETDDHTALVSKPRNKGGNGDLASAGFNIINSIIGSGIIGRCTFHYCVFSLVYAHMTIQCWEKCCPLIFCCFCWRIFFLLLFSYYMKIQFCQLRSGLIPTAFFSVMTRKYWLDRCLLLTQRWPFVLTFSEVINSFWSNLGDWKQFIF